MLENIFRYIEEKNCTPFEAAIQGTREVALAVMATTLSLVVIFLPIAFMNGYAKRFINPFGWTMAFAILVSMLVSFTLTPMLSSRFLKLSDAAADQKTKERGFFHWLDEWYTRPGELGARSLDRHHRHLGRHGAADDSRSTGWSAASSCRTRTWASGRSTSTRRKGTSLDGHDRGGLQAAQGTERHRRRRADRAVDRGLGPDRRRRRTSTSSVRRCRIDERKNTQAQIITEMRRRLAAHPELPAEHHARGTRSAAAKGTGGFAISANILGPDLDQIAEYSKKALVAAQKLPSLTEVKIGLNVSNPEVHVAVDRKRAADLGVRMATVGNTLRLAVSGDDEISLLQGRAGAVSGQDPRAREPARATSRRSAG